MNENTKDFILSDESLDILVSKVKDLEFVEKRFQLHGYRCCKCKDVAIRHRIANCDCIFCHGCYLQYHQHPCPVCRTVITESREDDEFMNTVLRFKVACEFKNNGCNAFVDLGNFLDHIKDCKLATKRLLPKIYKANPQTEALEEINADIQEMKDAMQDLRKEKEQLTDAMVEGNKKYEEIVEIQERNTIQMTRVTDDIQSLSARMEKLDKNQLAHQKEATEKQEEMVEMKKLIEELAKQLSTVTKDLLTRIDRIEMQNKALLADRRIAETEFLTFYRKHVFRETLPRDLEVQSDDPQTITFNWTISGVGLKMKSFKGWGDFATSEWFSIHSDGLKFRAKLFGKCHESAMYISHQFTGKSSFLHTRKYILVDQTHQRNGDGKEKRDVVMLDQPHFGKKSFNCEKHFLTKQQFFPIRLLRDSDKYAKNDKIVIRIILEPIEAMFKRDLWKDGTLLLKIDNYMKRKQEEIEGYRVFIVSEPFYTSAKGYMMDVEVYLNGTHSNQGKGISIRLMFRIGDWDDDLPSLPINCKYKRVLMNQSDARKKSDISYESEVRNYVDENSFNIYDDFILHEEVEKFPCLVDDCLLIKVVVELCDNGSNWKFWK